MENLLKLMPFIVAILPAVVSGIASYCAASRKASAEIAALRESNAHEITRLMEQHKLDIDSLERKHQMEIEKMELEHKHELELRSKDAENALGSEVVSTLMGVAAQTPEVRQALGQAFRSPNNSKRRRN